MAVVLSSGARTALGGWPGLASSAEAAAAAGRTPLTTSRAGSPRSARRACAITPWRSAAAARTLQDAACGVTTTCGSDSSGWPAGMGSGSQVSSAAAPTWPLSSAATSAGVSTRSPRPALTTSTPRRQRARRSAFSSRRVDGVDGQCRVTRSAAASRVSRLAAAQPAAATASAVASGSHTSTRAPQARRRAATARPMRPKPTTPAVMALSARMWASSTGSDQVPVRRWALMALMRRVRSRVSARVWSATSSMQ